MRFIHRFGNIGCCGSSVTASPSHIIDNLGTFGRGVVVVYNNSSGNGSVDRVIPLVLRGIGLLMLGNTATSGVCRTIASGRGCTTDKLGVGGASAVRGTLRVTGGDSRTNSVISLYPTYPTFSRFGAFRCENHTFGRLMGSFGS